MSTNLSERLISLLGSQVGNLAVGSITEDDKLNAMESKKFLSEFTSGISNTVLTFELSHLVGILQGSGKSVGIKRPSVDVRVDTEVGSCTIKERLTLLPFLACLKEDCADFVDVTLTDTLWIGFKLFSDSSKILIQLIGGIGDCPVCLVYGIRDILIGNGLHLLFVHTEGIVPTLILVVVITA